MHLQLIFYLAPNAFAVLLASNTYIALYNLIRISSPLIVPEFGDIDWNYIGSFVQLSRATLIFISYKQ